MRALVCFLALLMLPCESPMARPPSQTSERIDRTQDSRAWPHPVPARIRDGRNPDLFVMTLGDVDTPLADGAFDPSKDELTLKDGTVMKNYYRDKLGVKYYRPIDKSIFPLPPSGLCTWYYYYQDVNENEVKRNAEWIAKNLKDYGARYVQIDDGWQAETKTGGHGSRDWTGVDRAFPGGMAALAAYIKSLGLVPGIWIAPHGQSNEDVVRAHPGVFMLKPDGASASQSWEGSFLVDPSAPATQTYLKDLFTKLAGWGYEYFKIDGQTVVMDEYRGKASFMKNPGDPEALYRRTIASIREAIGPKRYLLGCWGIPLEGVGYMNGSRTGGDVVGGWSGFATALAPTMRWYFMHNIVWYTDPDVMLLRPPLTLDQARVWATLQGLTGQALMASDRLMDLSEDRVELMRRVYPAADIRPLDLFPAGRSKRIWDLKVNHLGRSYDVVGVFNYDEKKAETIYLNWQDLGLPEGAPIHVFDFWNHEYLGAWETGMAVDVQPTSVRVLTLVPASDRIALVSTNRHITQGWVDLVSFGAGQSPNSFRGTSRVIKDDPYELDFAFPRGRNFAVASAEARGGGPLPVKIDNHQGWATVRIGSPQTGEVEWNVSFAPADSYHYDTREPGRLRVERVGLDGADLHWGAQYYLNRGYQVYLDGKLLGFAGNTTFPLRNLDPTRTYTAEVRAVWEDASTGPRHRKAELQFTLQSLLPDELPLGELTPMPSAGRGGFRRFGGGDGRPVTVAGKLYDAAIGARAGSRVEYEVLGLYSTFTALVGVEDSFQGTGSFTFTVVGDGRELASSGPVTKAGGLKTLTADITGVKRLVLEVTAEGDAAQQERSRRGPRGGQAAWVDPRLTSPRPGTGKG